MYRGAMRHDPSTEGIKDRLHGRQSRKAVQAHAGVQSVGTDAGKKPCAHDCSGPNAAANAAFNAAATAGPRETTDAARLIGAGIIKGN